MPYFVIGDDAFPLTTYMMKPFSKRQMDDDEHIFNYRLSRARRIVENAFGILANRFQLLLTTMMQEPLTVQKIVVSCICLHNLMRMRYPQLQNNALDRDDANMNLIPGAWRDGRVLREVDAVRGGTRASREAKKQRLYLKNYYNNAVGSVPWQQNMI